MQLVIAIKPKNKQELIELWHKASKQYGAIEIRIDDFDEIPWKELESLQPTILATASRSRDELLRLAAMEPHYMDVASDSDPEIIQEIRQRYSVRIIASYHNHSCTEDDLDALYLQMRKIPCDVIKIATTAKTSIDGLRLLSLLKKRATEFPLIAIGMGDVGSFTRILAPLYNSHIAYSCLEGYSTAVGQLTYAEMINIYDYTRLSSATQPFALLGSPVSLSRSHITHNAIFKKFRFDCVYVKIEVSQEQFLEAWSYIQYLGFQGCSLTMPLKYELSELLQCKRAPYNTVKLSHTVLVCNTDAPAAADALEERIGPLKDHSCAIIGAGATAVSIADEVVSRGAHVTFYNRSKRFSLCQPLSDLQDTLLHHTVCIQASSCGMKDHETLGIEPEWFCNQVVALDVIGKEKTAFLTAVRSAGGIAISGVELFARQAAKQFIFWFPQLSEKEVLAALRENSVVIRPSRLRGRILPPPSKSHTLRAILFASFAHGVSTIYNPLDSPDTMAMIAICRQFGASITPIEKGLSIEGIGLSRQLRAGSFDAKNSGIVMRFGAAVAALFPEKTEWTGDLSMQTIRPMKALFDGLRAFGAQIEDANGFAPFTLQGPLTAGEVSIDGEDSQPVSALLIAASLLSGKSTIRVRNAGEKPWIDLTLFWLDRLGVSVERDGYECFQVTGKGAYKSFEYTVPADWSSALYPIACGLICDADIVIENLDFSDIQGDKKIVSLLQQMGAVFAVDKEAQTLRVRGPQNLKNIDVDNNDTIDAISLLAAVATHAKGVMRISNSRIARNKECDRIACTQKELEKMGASIEATADGLIISESSLTGDVLECYEDHRMCLSLTCAALRAHGETTLQGTRCVGKTYPTFFKDLQALGASLV